MFKKEKSLKNQYLEQEMEKNSSDYVVVGDYKELSKTPIFKDKSQLKQHKANK